MNELWFSVSKKERIFHWRKFRKTLVGLELTDALQKCVDWWSMTPISSNVFDAFDPESWLGPWDLVWAGEFDEDSIALGMAYTLQLEEIAQCEMMLVQRHDDNTTRLVVLVDNQYVLNYTYGNVAPASVLEKCDILHSKKIN